MFLGVLIGDALGMPAENLTPKEIQGRFGNLRTYEKSPRSGWEEKPAGSGTDDTQLTLAVANAIIDARGLDVDSQAKRHVEAFNQSVCGWGGTTRSAMEGLNAGRHWTESAPRGPGLGMGNAIAMKIAPVAAFFAAVTVDPASDLLNWPTDLAAFMRQFSQMTHWHPAAQAAGEAHCRGLLRCLIEGPGLDLDSFKSLACGERSLSPEFHAAMLQAFFLKGDEAVLRIGGEGKERFDSLHSVPLAYHCFTAAPDSIDSLFAAANAGGDTDTNASIVGALLGARFGRAVFPRELVTGLHPESFREVVGVTEKFIHMFEV